MLWLSGLPPTPPPPPGPRGGPLTLLGVGGDGGAHAVGADPLHGPRHGELLQAALEVAVLSLELLLHIQVPLVLLLQLLQE